eukprot:scaffold110705_cov37-Prasinocladus_malaysianus.AAC.1
MNAFSTSETYYGLEKSRTGLKSGIMSLMVWRSFHNAAVLSSVPHATGDFACPLCVCRNCD